MFFTSEFCPFGGWPATPGERTMASKRSRLGSIGIQQFVVSVKRWLTCDMQLAKFHTTSQCPGRDANFQKLKSVRWAMWWYNSPHLLEPGNEATHTHARTHTQPHPPLLHSKDTPTSNRTERIPGMRLHTHTLGMGWYRYQIFDIVNTGLRSDGIDICKHYQHVSIHARAALCMC